MPDERLKTLYVDELRDLLDAEHQLVKALPKMAGATTSPELKSGIEHHLEQTKTHAQRIEQILGALGEPAKGKKCKGMHGIVAEGKQILGEDYEGALRDSAIISAAQRVEHYEIAAYGCVREYAQLLGENEAVSLLGKTLEEEKETDAKLTEVAHTINRQAATGSGSDGEHSGDEGRKARRAAGAT
jgi:ferritin-like metal-binding protein YciE